jgi:hypothetical protein
MRMMIDTGEIFKIVLVSMAIGFLIGSIFALWWLGRGNGDPED